MFLGTGSLFAVIDMVYKETLFQTSFRDDSGKSIRQGQFPTEKLNEVTWFGKLLESDGTINVQKYGGIRVAFNY